jgi:predicted metalloprotease
LALACSLTFSACASPIAPSAKPENFYEAVRSDVEKFWAGYFSSQLDRTYTPIAKMRLFDRHVVSACGPADPGDGPFYCPDDEVVYLDSRYMQETLSDFGDFGSAVVVAHEIGHHVQNLLGLLDLNVRTIFLELQADCVAGGWMKDADARGLLEVGDPQEAANKLFDIGDFAFFHPDHHGTPQERKAAFRIGYLNGVSSC